MKKVFLILSFLTVGINAHAYTQNLICYYSNSKEEALRISLSDYNSTVLVLSGLGSFSGKFKAIEGKCPDTRLCGIVTIETTLYEGRNSLALSLTNNSGGQFYGSYEYNQPNIDGDIGNGGLTFHCKHGDIYQQPPKLTIPACKKRSDC